MYVYIYTHVHAHVPAAVVSCVGLLEINPRKSLRNFHGFFADLHFSCCGYTCCGYTGLPVGLIGLCGTLGSLCIYIYICIHWAHWALWYIWLCMYPPNVCVDNTLGSVAHFRVAHTFCKFLRISMALSQIYSSRVADTQGSLWILADFLHRAPTDFGGFSTQGSHGFWRIF